MKPDQVSARSAIESLRSGVPSRHAVDQLGTTQNHIKEAFETRLEAIMQGKGVDPLTISATFGAGKSHLLSYLKNLAAARGCVTSFVVVSPEMPLGNGHLVLKAIAEAAESPGRIGRALRSLAGDLNTSSVEYAALRNWTGEAGIDDRFAAMLLLYEEMRADEEFRTQLLSDIEGSPIVITVLRQQLKELGQTAAFSLKGQKNALLAHDRIRLLARFYRACGATGFVILFDELDRLAPFPIRQRLAAWEELGWWQKVAREEGAGILPVFAVLSGAVEQVLDTDEPRFRTSGPGTGIDGRDALGTAGIQLVKKPLRLTSMDSDQEAQIRYRVKSIYEAAYDKPVMDFPSGRGDVRISIRSEIRRWITLWDLHRCYPDYAAAVVADEVIHDTSEISDESIMASDDPDNGD